MKGTLAEEVYAELLRTGTQVTLMMNRTIRLPREPELTKRVGTGDHEYHQAEEGVMALEAYQTEDQVEDPIGAAGIGTQDEEEMTRTRALPVANQAVERVGQAPPVSPSFRSMSGWGAC